MEVNNLMIGDWYYNSDGDACKVTKNFGTNIWGQGNDVSDDTDDPHPMSITDCILTANGFEVERSVWWILFIGDYILGYNTETGRFTVDWEHINNGKGVPKSIISMRLEYVHELQHALRLCGLNELADNFKLE